MLYSCAPAAAMVSSAWCRGGSLALASTFLYALLARPPWIPKPPQRRLLVLALITTRRSLRLFSLLFPLSPVVRVLEDCWPPLRPRPAASAKGKLPTFFPARFVPSPTSHTTTSSQVRIPTLPHSTAPSFYLTTQIDLLAIAREIVDSDLPCSCCACLLPQILVLYISSF